MLAVNMIGKLNQTARSFATQSRLVFRKATVKDADLITQNSIREGFHVGPYDYSIFLVVDPHHYYMCEVDGELAAHVGVTYFPNGHYHGGGMIVKEKFRKQGVSKQCVMYVKSRCDPNYTIGVDVMDDTWYRTVGFTTHWEHYIAMLDLDKLRARVVEVGVPTNLQAQSILSEVNFDKLLQYDQSVFGTCRETFLKRWINTPGSFGWAATDKSSNEISGYTILKQIIRGGGTEIGLAMAPLYADNAEIARFLIDSRVSCEPMPFKPRHSKDKIGDISSSG